MSEPSAELREQPRPLELKINAKQQKAILTGMQIWNTKEVNPSETRIYVKSRISENLEKDDPSEITLTLDTRREQLSLMSSLHEVLLKGTEAEVADKLEKQQQETLDGVREIFPTISKHLNITFQLDEKVALGLVNEITYDEGHKLYPRKDDPRAQHILDKWIAQKTPDPS